MSSPLLRLGVNLNLNSKVQDFFGSPHTRECITTEHLLIDKVMSPSVQALLLSNRIIPIDLATVYGPGLVLLHPSLISDVCAYLKVEEPVKEVKEFKEHLACNVEDWLPLGVAWLLELHQIREVADALPALFFGKDSSAVQSMRAKALFHVLKYECVHLEARIRATVGRE